MAPRRVLLLVTGGIAAYKACFLTRLLVQAGFSVRVAMTEAAQRFVTPHDLPGPDRATRWPPTSGARGRASPWTTSSYARWADLVVVAPATANLLAKAADGIADDIVTTLLLAFPGPVLLAPAMNDNMWRHPATQANLATLRHRGVPLVGPGAGWLACGTVDVGRMAEPEEILAEVEADPSRAGAGGRRDSPHPRRRTLPWHGRRVVVTAGPTHEPIDPVRFLANRSSGVLGYALAAAAAPAGAEVTLISGPSDLVPPPGAGRSGAR